MTPPPVSSVALPETQRRALSWGPPEPKWDERPARSRWVLIADDDDVICELWGEALGTAGYRVIKARTGEAALELMAAVVPDLMILDLHMPGLSGHEVMECLCGNPVLRTLPVLIVSGFLDAEPHDAAGLKIVGALSKPVALADLLRSVETALTKTDGRRSLV